MEQQQLSSKINEENNFISSVICDNENKTLHELDLHYIFVVDEESQTNIKTNFSPSDTHEIHIVEKRENPINPSNEPVIINNIKNKIEELCNLKNIIIYVLLANSSFKYNRFVELFNFFLRNTIPNKYYSNIIIFNFFDSNHLKLDNVNTPIYVKYNSCNKYCLSNIINSIDNSKKFFNVTNVFCNSNFSYTLFKHPEKINVVNVYKFIHSTELYNYENIKSLITERRCSSGKLIQFTGTCWINAILNALLLPKSSRKYMINQCRKNIKTDIVKNNTKLEDIYKLRDTLTYNNILTSIIYQIFINKKLPSKLNKGIENDFILTLGDKIKRIWAKNEMKNKLDLLNKDDYKRFNSNDINFGIGAGPDCINFSLKEIIGNYLKDFQYTYRVFIFNLPVKFTEKEINKMEKPPIEKRIKQGSSYYQLTSCLFSQSSGHHEICGFICEGKEYIYNSNIKKAIECNWSNYDYKEYIAYYKELEVNRANTIYMEVLIYTLETPVDIKENTDSTKEVEEEAKSIIIPDVPCKLPPPPTLNKTKNCSRPNQELINGKCLTKCKETQIRNPITGRCKINKNTVKCTRPNQELINGKCLTKCKETQIRNPITGRCKINKNNNTVKCTRPNQELINGKCLTKCKETQIRNPITGRCKKQ